MINVKKLTKAFLVLLFVFSIFFIADVVTTEIGLVMGLHEGNPENYAMMNTYGRPLTYSMGAFPIALFGVLSFALFEKISLHFSKKWSLIFDYAVFTMFSLLVLWLLYLRISTVFDNIQLLLKYS